MEVLGTNQMMKLCLKKAERDSCQPWWKRSLQSVKQLIQSLKKEQPTEDTPIYEFLTLPALCEKNSLMPEYLSYPTMLSVSWNVGSPKSQIVTGRVRESK